MANPFTQRYIYNSKCNYYFISVIYFSKTGGPSWIRKGFLTQDEVIEFISEIKSSKKQWKNLEIYSEDKLSNKVFIDIDNQKKEITLRELFFDERYAASGPYYERITTDGAELREKVGFDYYKATFSKYSQDNVVR